jgi:Tol biopolymer transport system component
MKNSLTILSIVLAIILLIFSFGCQNVPIKADTTIDVSITAFSLNSFDLSLNIKNAGSTITASGVCWNTTQNPTISDNKTNDVLKSAAFTSSITGLTPGTTYYIRAYLTTKSGTTYSQQVTATTIASNINGVSSNISVTDYNTGLYDLYLYNTENNTNTRITNTPNVTEIRYLFFHDSKKILFFTPQGGYTINLDGSGQTLLIDTLTIADLSPDDKELVYVKHKNLLLMNSDGTNIRQLSNESIGCWFPKWSRDGQKIMYSKNTTYTSSKLDIITLNGNVSNLLNFSSTTSYDWTFDSKGIVYSKGDSNHVAHIFRYDLSAGSETQLSTGNNYGYYPACNPVNDEICSTSAVANSNGNLMLMNLMLMKSDGTQQSTIFHNTILDTPYWSPDGNHVTFITGDSYSGYDRNVGIIDVDGSNYRIINSIKGECSNPVWSPDRKYILYFRALWSMPY